VSGPLWFDNLSAYCLQTIVLVATADLLPRLFRLRAPRVMLTYWQVLLALCLLWPLLQPWKHLAQPTTAALAVNMIRAGPKLHPAGRVAFTPPVFDILALVLLLGIVARFVQLALGLGKLRSYRRRARPLHPLPPAVHELELMLKVRPRCCLSEDINSPVSFGQINPVILLPSHFLEMGGGAQKAILCHEFLHVRRHDWMRNLAEETAAAVLWFHPAVWWPVRRIRLAREEVVDAEVLQLTRDRKPYLDALLEMAAYPGRVRALPAPLFFNERQLAERVALLLKEVHMPKSRLIASLVGTWAILLLSGVLAVRAFPLKVAPQSSKPEAGQNDPCSDRYWLPCIIQSSEPETAQGESLRPAFYIVSMTPMLSPVRKVSPVYPASALAARIEGEVVLEATVDAAGSISDLKVKSGPPLLVKAALDAVRQWKFAQATIVPGLAAGPQLPATTSIALRFVLTRHNWSDLEWDGGVGYLNAVIVGGPNYPDAALRGFYPDEALREHVEGQVLLEVTADQDSRVSDARVLKSDSPLLTEAAIRFVQQQPAFRSPGVNKVLVEFQLSDKSIRDDGPQLTAEGILTQAPPDLLIMHKEITLYPEEVQKDHLEGDVQVRLSVTADGEVTDAKVVSGPEPLQEAALEAARKWRFGPPSEGPVDVTVTYHFWLPDKPAKAGPG
jgi:TonB family protein